MNRKLREKTGETIAETLVSLLIACLAMLMLAGALVSATRVNEKTRTMDTEFQVEAESCTSEAGTVKFTHGSSVEEEAVTVYESNDHNDYLYYEITEDD